MIKVFSVRKQLRVKLLVIQKTKMKKEAGFWEKGAGVFYTPVLLIWSNQLTN